MTPTTLRMVALGKFGVNGARRERERLMSRLRGQLEYGTQTANLWYAFQNLAGVPMIDLDTKFGRKVKRRLKKEDEIWLTTTGPDGTPQPRPIWFWWDGASFLFYSQAKAHKLKHIARHNKVALHFNTRHDDNEAELVVFHGVAEIDLSAPAPTQNKPYFKKYRQGIKDIKMTPEEYDAEYTVAIRVKPYALRGW